MIIHLMGIAVSLEKLLLEQSNQMILGSCIAFYPRIQYNEKSKTIDSIRLSNFIKEVIPWM